MEITDGILDFVIKWCEDQIEPVIGILEGRIAPQRKGNDLILYKYPPHLANAIGAQLEKEQ